MHIRLGLSTAAQLSIFYMEKSVVFHVNKGSVRQRKKERR